MSISERQRTMSWQIKTTDGSYYQPDSLDKLYLWIFENRISADDSIFSIHANDWVPLVDMQELSYCFWHLLTSGGAVYGPASIGELKQLYRNNQIKTNDKVAVYGSDQWKRIDDLPTLNNWLIQKEVSAIDYINFIEKLKTDYLRKPGYIKQEKLETKFRAIEDEGLKGKKTIDELDNKINELDGKLREKEAEAESLREDIEEKSNIIEVLNKQIAQAEVAQTLKNDEISQMCSNIELLKKGIEVIKSESADGGAVFSQELERHKKISQELNSEKEGLQAQIDILKADKEDLHKNIISLHETILEKDKILENVGDSAKDYLLKAEEDLKLKKSELEEINKLMFGYDNKISEYEEKIARLQEETAKRDAIINEIKNTAELDAGIKQEKINNLEADIESRMSEYRKETEELRNAINERDTKLDSINKLLEEKENIVNERRSGIMGLESMMQAKGAEIEDLKNKVESKDEEIAGFRDTVARLQSELTERDIELSGIKNLNGNINDVRTELSEHKQKVEELNNLIIDKDRMISNAENEKNMIKGDLDVLKSQIYVIKQEYDSRIKGLEETIDVQRSEFQKEIDGKRSYYENELSRERKERNDLKRELDGILAQKDAELENLRSECQKLNYAISEKEEYWQGKLNESEEIKRMIKEEMDKKIENQKSEFTQKVSKLLSENESLNVNISEIEKTYKEVIAERDRFIKETDELNNQLNSYISNTGLIQKRVSELEVEVQNGLAVREELKKDIKILSEELENAKGLIQIMKDNKDKIEAQLSISKDEFDKIISELQKQLDDARQNLENISEENKNLQKQFYIEKQKLTREYSETINKQEKLFKRGQLEREIQDHTRVREEVEKLYNLLKESFTNIQRGSTEIEAALQNMGNGIDEKKLSLKYLIESEKREEKKNQLFKSDSTEEADSVS